MLTEDDENQLIPLSPKLREKATPEMIVPRYDFGPEIGTHDAIRLHDMWLLVGISDQKMEEIDAARAEKGLRPMFGDDGL